MIRFAALIAALTEPGGDRAVILADYLTFAPEPDAQAAIALLSGQRPKRRAAIATLRSLILHATALPDWLFDATRAATGDSAEALGLILPAPDTPDPTPLAETLTHLATLNPDALLPLIQSTAPKARAPLIRLATGTFRLTLPAGTIAEARARAAGQTPPAMPRTAPRHSLTAVMIYAEAALPPGAPGPEVTLALWAGDHPIAMPMTIPMPIPIAIPIARLRAALPDADRTALLTWVRAHATDRFGPIRQVPATQVFTIGFDAVTPNRRRKSGVALINPQILSWHRGADPATAAQLRDLTDLLPDQP